MKFTLNWLKQYVDIDLTPAALADTLTMLGLEVDAVEELYSGLEQVRAAEIKTVRPHPNADKLVLCDVAVGGEIKRVVCGAPNARAGLKTAIALPGQVMPGGFTIKKSKIRGERSEGMLCSESELGLGDSHDGIMELPDEVQAGLPLTDALGLRDTMIEVDLTPNRPDCACVYGVAREVAGATERPLKAIDIPSLPSLDGSGGFTVTVEAPEACRRYAARLVTGVTPGPSPWWLRRMLLAVGLRPINNIVDITNFVMLEMGQPLHAFDFSKIDGGRIVVRTARDGERITTLDGMERPLEPGTLLICDGKRPVAVAGVMGGENSEVGAETRDILLESAYFDPVGIRRASRSLKLGTDASYRFERGVDPHATIRALDRAAALIAEIAGGRIGGGVDCRHELPVNPTIELRTSKTNALLGTTLTTSRIAAYLNGIEIPCRTKDDDTLVVSPPSFRVDLEREVDLVEEVARLTGYNEIATTMPVVPMSFSEESADRTLRARLAGIMTASGLCEAINYSFTGERHHDQLGLPPDDPLRRSVRIVNPLTEDQAVMRTTLLPGLLDNLRHNLNRQNTDIGLFEIGKTFHPLDGREQPREPYHLCVVMTGRRDPGAPVLHYGQHQADLLDVKGLAETIGREIRRELILAPAEKTPPWCETGQCLDIMAGGTPAGFLATVGRETLRRFGIKQPVHYLDLDLEAILAAPATPVRFTPLSKYPAVKWDLAFIVADSVGAGDMVRAIEDSGLDYVQRAEIFDVYSGKPIEKGYKSVALSITYHSDRKTLSDKAVNKVHQRIIKLIGDTFGGRLREE